MKLKEWIRGMKKIFTIIEVLEKKVNIGAFYLIRETDIWWSTMKGMLVGPKLT